MTRDARAGEWVLKREGGAEVLRTRTKVEAVVEGRGLGNRILRSGGRAQLKVHRADHVIQTEYTYGADPRRTPG